MIGAEEIRTVVAAIFCNAVKHAWFFQNSLCLLVFPNMMPQANPGKVYCKAGVWNNNLFQLPGGEFQNTSLTASTSHR